MVGYVIFPFTQSSPEADHTYSKVLHPLLFPAPGNRSPKVYQSMVGLLCLGNDALPRVHAIKLLDLHTTEQVLEHK